MKYKLKKLLSSQYVRAVGVLAGGTAVSQGITISALPLLTRIYSPEDFGVLAIYVAIVSIVSTVSCLRLEIAIPLPEKDQDAANLLVLALIISIIFGLLSLLIVIVAPAQILNLVGSPKLEPFLWLIPVSIWVTSTYNAIQYWSTRKRQFGAIARTRLTQSITGTGIQLLGGILSIGSIGLLSGQIFKNCAGVWRLARLTWLQDKSSLILINGSDLRRVFRKYDRFPKYSTLESFANIAGIQVPILIVASYLGGKESGYLMLAMQIMSSPIGLLGSSISQVYLSHAPEHLRRGDLAQFTVRCIAGLMKLGVLPLILIGGIAPAVFPLVFGTDWGRAGQLLAWMTPWFILQFITSPVSMVLHIKDRQKTAFLIQIFGLILRVSIVFFVGLISKEYIAEAYAISGAIFYLIYFFIIKKVSDFSWKDLFKND